MFRLKKQGVGYTIGYNLGYKKNFALNFLTGLLLVWLFVILTGALTPVLATGQTADDYVQMARQALREKNLINADNYFKLALQEEPGHDEANFFYAFTRILSLIYDPDFNILLDRFGVSANGRDLYQWEAEVITDPNDDVILPDNAPTGGEIQNFINLGLIDKINGALTNLEQIEESFQISVSDEVLSDEVLEIDYGDVLMARSLFRLARSFLFITHVYHIKNSISS